jgi:hypothetical protein
MYQCDGQRDDVDIQLSEAQKARVQLVASCLRITGIVKLLSIYLVNVKSRLKTGSSIDVFVKKCTSITRRMPADVVPLAVVSA